MRRVLGGLVLLLAVATARVRAQTQDTVVVGVAGELSALPNDSLRVPVFVDLRKAAAQKLGSYTVRATWNPNVFYYNGWHAGAFAVPLVRTDSVSQGVLWASAVSAAGLGGVFNLFDLSLRPGTPASDSVRVQVTELSAAGSLANLLSSATVLVENAAFCPALGRWGDLDGDQAANSRDALAILSAVVGLPVGGAFNLALGDVDGDGKANSRDALILLSYAVGLDIPGQRVLLVAAGPCGGTVPAFSVAPDTADLVPGQAVQLRVFGRDSSGRAIALDNLTWSVADPYVAAIDTSGTVIGRIPGTTTLTTAVGPGVRVTVPVVVRSRRGTWYVDAQRAQRASVQLGTQRWPFSTPQFAFPFAAEGDTVRVAPGAVDYKAGGCYGECSNNLNYSQLGVGLVVIGDTLADGTRPVLRARSLDYLTAFPWVGGLHGEVVNLVLRGFEYGVDLAGLKSLTFRNVQVEIPQDISGYGIRGLQYADTIRVLGSRFVGDTAAPIGYGVYLSTGTAASYLQVQGSAFESLNYGLYLANLDSLDLRQSAFDNNGNAIYQYYYSAGIGASISRSRFGRGAGTPIYLGAARSAAFDHNYIQGLSGTAIEVDGVGSPVGAPPVAAGPSLAPQAQGGGRVTMSGDSVLYRGSSYPIYVQYMDSVSIDSLWAQVPPDTLRYASGIYLYRVKYARVARSSVLNTYYYGIQFTGRQLVVDQSQFTGCAGCAWTAGTGVSAYAYDFGPRLSITNSVFSKMSQAVTAGYSNDSAGPMVVVGNQVDSVAQGFNLTGDSLVVTDNVMTRMRDYGLAGQPGYTANYPFVQALIARNQVTCSVAGYSSYGLRHDNGPARFEDNAVRQCRGGLQASNTGYPLAAVSFLRDTVMPDSTAYYRFGIQPYGKWIATIAGNRIVGGYVGIDVEVNDSTGPATVDSNAVSGTSYAGLYLYAVPGSVTGRKNNISNNQLYGLYSYYGQGVRNFTLGRFVGNGRYGLYSYGTTGTFGAQSNWWGDAKGPRCATGCDVTSAGDSVAGTVDASSPLATDPGDAPPLAPLLSPVAGTPALSAAVQPALVPARPAPDDLRSRLDDPRPRLERERAELEARRAAEKAARDARLQPGGLVRH